MKTIKNIFLSAAMLCMAVTGLYGTKFDSLEDAIIAIEQGETDVNLSFNGIGPAGAIALARAIPGSNLEVLRLSNNEIGNAGTMALARAIPGSNLRVLDLSLNLIGDRGAKAIAGAIPDSNLEALDLIDNRVGAAGEIALAEALKENYSLTTMPISLMNKEIINRIDALLERNQSLQEVGDYMRLKSFRV